MIYTLSLFLAKTGHNPYNLFSIHFSKTFCVQIPDIHPTKRLPPPGQQGYITICSRSPQYDHVTTLSRQLRPALPCTVCVFIRFACQSPAMHFVLKRTKGRRTVLALVSALKLPCSLVGIAIISAFTYT